MKDGGCSLRDMNFEFTPSAKADVGLLPTRNIAMRSLKNVNKDKVVLKQAFLITQTWELDMGPQYRDNYMIYRTARYR